MTFIDNFERQLVDAARKKKAKQKRNMVKANVERAQLINYLETEGTFSERLWLPLIRFVHRRCS